MSRTNSECVVSDVAIKNGDISIDQFNTMMSSGSSAGYDDFKNFIGGDYEFKDAIFRGILTTTDANLPRITALEVNVDVPDVFDRGTATTLSYGVLTVVCSRHFYTLSEVVATCKGGTIVAVPRVSNLRVVAGVGMFDVELIDITDARVAGQVSWQAKGY